MIFFHLDICLVVHMPNLIDRMFKVYKDRTFREGRGHRFES